MASLPVADIKEVGRHRVTVFHYVKAGDELPAHVHDDANNHATFISAGRFRVTGDPAISGSILERGMFVDWPAGQQHGFVALEDGSRMIQLPK